MLKKSSILQRYALSKAIFRKERIVELCEGKSVLHLGFIQHASLYTQLIKKGDWLHSKICDVANECFGVDYLKDGVDVLREEYGFDGIYGDAMKLDDLEISRTYDVIVCGELIEHIENPGQMLDGLKRFMHQDSVLIITTPSPWSLIRLFRNRSEERWLNGEHVAWYSFHTLRQLLERKGFLEYEYSYYFNESIVNLEGIFRSLLRVILLTISPLKNYGGLFFICTKEA